MTIKWLQNFQPDSGNRNSTTLFDLVSKIDSTDSTVVSVVRRLTDRIWPWYGENASGFIDKLATELVWPEPCGLFNLGRPSAARLYRQKSMMLITWSNSWSAAGTQLGRNWLMRLLTSGRNDCCWSPFVKWTYWTSLALIPTFNERSDWFANDLCWQCRWFWCYFESSTSAAIV